MPRRIKGFDFQLVMGDENEECFAHLGTSRTGGTRRTINSSNSQNLALPDSRMPLLLNSSNHQSYPSHMSYTSHCSNSGAKHPCPHLSFLHFLHFYTAKPTHTQLKTNLQAIWQVLCKQNPPQIIILIKRLTQG